MQLLLLEAGLFERFGNPAYFVKWLQISFFAL